MASKCLRRSYVKSVLNNLSLRSNRSRAIHCGSNQILCAEHHDDSHKNAAKDQTEFRVYEIAGLKKEERKRKTRPQRAPVPPDRSKRLSPDDDWTSVWPARAMFKSSVINFPVRQGLIKSSEENEGVSPGRYANAELMKIPNFLHLTPAHIKAHCQAIKKFCTPWPKGLETDEKCEQHFPLEVIYSNYLSAGPSIRNPKARVLTAKIKISHLGLDYHAKDKLARLAGDRYNKETEELVLTSDRCPMVKQNKDFVFYLLTALFYESRKTEAWEDEKTEADMECYYWDISQSRKTVISLINHMQQADNQPGESDAVSQKPEDIVQLKSVQDYKEATSALQNQGESRDNLDQYKQAVLQLFNIKQPSQDL